MSRANLFADDGGRIEKGEKKSELEKMRERKKKPFSRLRLLTTCCLLADSFIHKSRA